MKFATARRNLTLAFHAGNSENDAAKAMVAQRAMRGRAGQTEGASLHPWVSGITFGR